MAVCSHLIWGGGGEEGAGHCEMSCLSTGPLTLGDEGGPGLRTPAACILLSRSRPHQPFPDPPPPGPVPPSSTRSLPRFQHSRRLATS